MNATLYPYQKVRIRLAALPARVWLSAAASPTTWVLGKTITDAVVFCCPCVAAEKDNGDAPHTTDARTSIVVPRSLLFNWDREAQRFTPDLKILTYADGSRPFAMPAAFDGYDLIVTDHLRHPAPRHRNAARRYPFHYAVLDEAQAVKNPLSLTSRASRLPCNSEHKLDADRDTG